MTALVGALNRLLDERHRLNRWLRLNASANRSLPWEEGPDSPLPADPPAPAVEKIPVEVKVTHDYGTPKPVEVKVDVATKGGTEAKAVEKLPQWAKAVIAAVLAAAAGAGLANHFGGTAQNPPPVTTDSESEGLLLPYLEDEGFHLGE